MKAIDLTGQTFGRLTVISRSPFKGRQPLWECRCDCGNTRIVYGFNLRTGNTQSCGCLKIERIGAAKYRHGHSPKANQCTRTYTTWSSMIQRCTNPKHKDFKDYMGRGITVCERWLDFVNFLEDMGVKPEGLSIDRINNDGNYEPGNCRWATAKEQRANRKRVAA